MSLHTAAISLARLLAANSPTPCADPSTRVQRLAKLPKVQQALTSFRRGTGSSPLTLGPDPQARTAFADRLTRLVDYPWDLNQRGLSACGTAAFLHIWLKRDPASAAQYATDLFEHGHARIGSLDILPSQDLLKQDYQQLYAAYNAKLDQDKLDYAKKGIDYRPDYPIPEFSADWVMISALRDSTRGFGRFLGIPAGDAPDTSAAAAGYQDELTGMVDPAELQSWLNATGLYSAVVNNTNVPSKRLLSEALALSPDDSRDTVVLMSTQMLKTNLAKRDCDCGQVDEGETFANLLVQVTPNHYVVLENPIELTPAPERNVRLCFWCWGDTLLRQNVIGSKTNAKCSCMPFEVDQASFGNNFYGAVIAVRANP